MHDGFKLGMVQQQNQTLIMNQEMRQAIAILQLSGIELTSYIEQQVESNPLLSIDHLWRKKKSNVSTNPSSLIETVSRSTQTLETTLLEQLSFVPLTLRKEQIARYIIGSLDSDGYLREDLQQIAEQHSCTLQEVEEVLAIIQSFEPAGVAARNLQECLLLQLKAKGKWSNLAERIVTHHLIELAERKFVWLAEQYEVSVDDIVALLAAIEQLNPRPGAEYDESDVTYIIPDLFLTYENGVIHIVVNEQMYPHLEIDMSYVHEVQQQVKDKQVQHYIREHLRSARWLIRSIEQRKATILKVAEAIFQVQKDFLQYGEEALHPLTLSDIANMIQMHESTVSRATKHKYVQTPKGLFELKSFFIHKLQTKQGVITPYRIKQKIAQFIQQEQSNAPLSDQQIANLLQQEGIHISRRTVMKYREELSIPSSSKRRSKG